MKLNTKIACICLVSIVLALSTSVALAAPSVSLSWYKNNGYGMGNDIGGEWTITADVSVDVSRVEFYVDDALVQNATASPFKWAFNTADYSLGEHTIKAVAYASGETATAQAERNFVEYSAADVLLIVVGVVVVVFVVVLVAALYKVKKK